MDIKKLSALLILSPLVLIQGNCASGTRGDATYLNPNMDFGLIQTVAVLPFRNLAGTGAGGETVRDVMMTLLQARVDVYVIPPGEVARAISRVGPEDPTAPSQEEALRLAENLEADVLLTGVVLELGEVRSGTARANVCSLSVKMLESQTGTVIWSTTATRGGVGASERLLGGGGKPLNIVITQAVDDVIDELFP